MNDERWEILGIAPTTDKEAIREAYLVRLPGVHPEEDPDGFRLLREAYEAALTGDGGEEAEEEEDTSLSGQLVKGMKEIADDFTRRLDPEEWRRTLMAEPLCQLDIQSEVSEKLLILFMEDYYIPQAIWCLLDEFFGWTAQAKLLKERFPENYIDYVVSCVRYEENVRAKYFDLSDAGTDFEDLLRIHRELSQALNEQDGEAAKAAADEALEKGCQHPDILIQLLRYHTANEAFETAEALAGSLLADYPDDPRVSYQVGCLALQTERPQQALLHFEKTLEHIPDHYNARVGIVRAYFDSENFETAKAKALEMLTTYRYDTFVGNLLHAASEKLIDVYEAALESAPENQELIYKLASCYYNEDRYEDCIALVKENTPDEAHIAKHSELLFDALIANTEDPSLLRGELVSLLKDWEAHATERLRLRNLPGDYLYIGMPDEAYDKAEIYLREFPGDPEISVTKAQVLRERGETAEAIKTISAALGTDASHPRALKEMASLMYEIGDIAEAVHFAEESVSIFPYDYDLWAMIIQIYFDANQAETVLRVISDAEGYGMEGPFIDRFKAAATLRAEDDEERTAAAAQVLLDLSEADPEDAFALSELADWHMSEGNFETAAELFTRLIALDDANPEYYHARGFAYTHIDQAETGEADLRKAIELDPAEPLPWFHLGVTLYYEDALTEAVHCFEEVLRIDPDFRAPYIYLIKSYGEMGAPEKALESFDRTIALFPAPNAADEEEDAERAEELGKFLLTLKEEKLIALQSNNHYVEAVQMENEVLNRYGRSENAEVYTALANSHYELHEDDDAEALYKKAIELAPEDGDVLRKYAFFLSMARKDLPAAIAAYEKANAFTPMFQSHIRLAKLQQESGAQEQAAENYRKAIEILDEEEKIGKRPCFDYFRGEALYGLGQDGEAEVYLLRAMERAKDFVACNTHYCYEASFLLAKLALARGDLQQAKAYYADTLRVSQDREYREAHMLFETENE